MTDNINRMLETILTGEENMRYLHCSKDVHGVRGAICEVVDLCHENDIDAELHIMHDKVVFEGGREVWFQRVADMEDCYRLSCLEFRELFGDIEPELVVWLTASVVRWRPKREEGE